jgi:hypothetical protein
LMVFADLTFVSSSNLFAQACFPWTSAIFQIPNSFQDSIGHHFALMPWIYFLNFEAGNWL